MIRAPSFRSTPVSRLRPRARTVRAGAPLLPGTRSGGPIPWVIAILIALVVVAAAGGLSLRNLAQNARGDLAQGVTVQIIEADADKRAALAADVADAMRGSTIVTSVRIVPERELQSLLEPWLGAGVVTDADSGEVPIPALVDIELSQVASPKRLAQLRARLADVLGSDAASARVDAQSSWLEPVYDALSALQWLALALIALIAAATAAAVWLAARSAFANHRETVEIVHLLGGSDAQVTRAFQRAVLRDAAIGASLGLAIGVAAVWVLAQQFAQLDSGMAAGGGLRLVDGLAIAAIPLGGVLIALVTARMTIGAALRSLL